MRSLRLGELRELLQGSGVRRVVDRAGSARSRPSATRGRGTRTSSPSRS